MNTYAIALFLHVVGALAYFATVGLLLVSVVRLRRATTTPALREWAELAATAERWIPASVTLILLSGGYMIATASMWRAMWVIAALGTFATLAPLFPLVLGHRFDEIRDAARAAATESISPALVRQTHDVLLAGTSRLIAALSLGIVFLMTAKPDGTGSLIAIGIALALGFVPVLPVRRRTVTLSTAAH